MDPNTLEAWATTAGVAVAAALGIVGIVQARRAKKAASQANELAGQANDLANKANELNEKANEIIQAQDARARERSDVEFEWSWDTTNLNFVVIQNIGKSPAKNVVAQFWVDGKVEANDKAPLDIEGRQETKFKIDGLAQRRVSAAQEGEVTRLGGHKPIVKTVQTRLRVSWETPLGSFGRSDTGYQDSALVTSRDNVLHLVTYLDNAPDSSQRP